MPEKDRRGDKGALPQTPWFLNQSRQPFKTALQKPWVFVAPDIAGIEVKHSADRPDEFYVQFFFVPVYPLFLLGCRHASPHLPTPHSSSPQQFLDKTEYIGIVCQYENGAYQT